MSTTATTETKPAPSAIEKIRVKVDGREIEVPRLMADWSGKLVPTTMIQACELARRTYRIIAIIPSCPSPAIAACASSSSAPRRSDRTANRF